MQVLSVNVGLPRIVEYNGEPLATGIFKEPVEGTVRVGHLNLEGDGQADLRVHGGTKKAVYVYPSEHYEFWRAELPALDLSYGVFGENLTTEGIRESDVRAGDRLTIGTSEFAVTIPRYPCFKLGIRFAHIEAASRNVWMGSSDIIRRFVRAGRSGFYLEVIRPGELKADDPIEMIRSGSGKTIAETYRNRLNQSG
jgi:MOSC domain-containing protein YiiM